MVNMVSILEDHDFDTFEADWDTYNESQKETFIEDAAGLDPGLAIIAVLKGFSSFHFSIRAIARKTLTAIQSNIEKQLMDDDPDIRKAGQKASASVCARIYECIHTSLPIGEQHFYLSRLFSFGEEGARFVFMAAYLKRVSPGAMEKIILSVPEQSRMLFIDHYLKAIPTARLSFARIGRRILQSIEEKKTVLEYLASLFDRKREIDAFLLNIDAQLLDPDQITQQEVFSPSAAIRCRGLKVLAMILPQVSSELLSDILEAEQDPEVRKTVFKIVERSCPGAYQDLFDVILAMMDDVEATEQFYAAKALIVSGKEPIYTVFEIIQKKYPELTGVLAEQISGLTRLSFLVLQDIAVNRGKYTGGNLEIAMAGIYGIIKKRPERVVRVLKYFDSDSDDDIRLGVTSLMEIIRQYLDREKQSIEKEFEGVIKRAEKKISQNRGLLRQLFHGSETKRKIEQLKDAGSAETINFEGAVIRDETLSAIQFSARAVFFNACIVFNCDFSASRLFGASFRKAVLYNLDFRNTRFEKTSFDNAFLIHVNAAGAQFHQCSFQNTVMFNCSFKKAVLKDTPFVAATISKCSFNGADLSGSIFAHARISAVSLVDANIEHAAFSGVRARFCRFPPDMRHRLSDSDIDYNDRRYQLGREALPSLNQEVIDRLYRIIFNEFIHYGESRFLRQNKISLLTAYDIFKPKQAHLFQIIPYLLHENLSFPGMDEIVGSSTPCGIQDYMPDYETRTVLAEYISRKNIQVRRQPQGLIKGLFTIGSTGSLAQTTASDMDWWVCMDEDKLSKQDRELLKSKLEALEKLAMKLFATQVTFFVVDLERVKNNDFGDSTIESSGSAQTRLLKEEFYRTMIHVAGKLPLWAVLPSAVSVHYYNSIVSDIQTMSLSSRYLDLGDIHAISTSEYFGASIWQMFKWLKSPFKSVIKMALLEKYIHEYGRKPLLCNLYKDEWMNAGLNLGLAGNDSYYVLLKHLLAYFSDLGDKESVGLMLSCFFLKLGISNDAQVDDTVFGIRRVLLEKCLNEWGWSRAQVFRIGDFQNWPYRDIMGLSRTIQSYMIKKYKTVSTAFERIKHNASPLSPEDRTALSRKVFVECSRSPGKVEKVLLVSRNEEHLAGLHLKYVKKRSDVGTWELINRQSRSMGQREEVLKGARTIEEIGAWLMNNGLYHEQGQISLIPNPTYVTHDDIKKMFKALNDFLDPYLQQVIGLDPLLKKSRVTCLFVSVNFYAPRQQQVVSEYTAIYMNSWGEMFCKSVYSSAGFPSMEGVKKDILGRLKIRKMPLNTVYYFSKGAARH